MGKNGSVGGIAKEYEVLKAENTKLEGELAMRKRGRYGKGSEKPSGKTHVHRDLQAPEEVCD